MHKPFYDASKMSLRGERVTRPNPLGRIPPNGSGRKPAKEPYRGPDEGIREWDPKPQGRRVVVLTERVSPSIRSTVGLLYPLEHYDEKLSLDPLAQYAELLLLMGSNGAADFESVHAILREARNHLRDDEYGKLVGYVDLMMVGRIGIPAELP